VSAGHWPSYIANNAFIEGVFVTALISTVAAPSGVAVAAISSPAVTRQICLIYLVVVMIIYRVSNMSRGRSALRRQLALAKATSLDSEVQTGQRSEVNGAT